MGLRKTFTRKAQLLAGCAVAAVALNTAVAAQDQDDEEEESIEEVVVTGSRISRRDVEAPNPVLVIGAADIAASGETDISQLLREIPALNGTITATSSTQAASNLTSAIGVGRADLRNLGSLRALVMVNGRRHVGAIQGENTVDLNSIPVNLIERVDVVTGGGSAVYGSDAVSGVVNFILKDDYEGLEASAQFGISDEGDAETYQASILGGANFDDGKGNFVFSAEYTRETPIFSRDRQEVAGTGLLSLIGNSPELTAAFGLNPDAANVFVPDRRINFSSADGIIRLYDQNSAFGSVFDGLLGDTSGINGVPPLQVFSNGALREFSFGVSGNNLFASSGGDGIEVVNPHENRSADVERVSMNLNTNYDIAEGIEFFAETKFVYMQARDNDSIAFNDDIPIAIDNPFIPAPLRAQIDAALAAGQDPAIVISRDILDEDVISGTDTDRYTLRLVGGFRGEFENGWNWEASYNYGRTEINTDNTNSRIEDRFFAGIDAVIDPATGEIVCRSDIDPSAEPPTSPFPASRTGFLTFTPGAGSGCVPINIFGQDSITAESAEFAFTNATDRSLLEQRDILLTLSGDTAEYFELPAGPIGFAVGFEYREEFSSFTPSDIEQAGLLYATLNESNSPVSGGVDFTEFFGEVSVPILADLPFAEFLNVGASYRHTDHSTAGGIDAYDFNMVWQIVPDFRIRGSYARAVRAPNIFELFSPPQLAFIGVGADPCNPENISAGTEFREQNCLAFVDAGFNAGDFLTARVAGTTGGNPLLNPEVSDTYTIGGVFTPSFAPGLVVTVDYFNLEITDAIGSLSGASIAEFCVDLEDINNDFCSLVDRDPTDGFITGFRSGNVNLSAFRTEGIDFAVSYAHDLSETFGIPGMLSHRVNGTYTINNRNFPDQNDPEQVFEDVGEIGVPDWIVNYSAGWDYEDFSINYQLRFQSSQLLPGIENEDIISNPLFADPFRSGAGFAHDISFRWQAMEDTAVTLGINNFTDVKPFIASNSRPVSAIGRFFFLRVNHTF